MQKVRPLNMLHVKLIQSNARTPNCARPHQNHNPIIYTILFYFSNLLYILFELGLMAIQLKPAVHYSDILLSKKYIVPPP